jgi:transaldolase
LQALSDAGVSIWLDDLSRQRLATGNLAALVADYNVSGVTTNPTIFAAALASRDHYTPQLSDLAANGVDADQAIRTMTTDDVRAACDVLAEVYTTTGGRDGRVSIEVDPRLAFDTDATVANALDLWKTVERPNAMIKIPATEAGLPAITAVLAQGISVNVTLIFGLPRYRAVIEAYLSGLEQAAANGHDLATIHSVASFFISRVDTEFDARLTAVGTEKALALRGHAAIANARLAYGTFTDVFGADRFAALAVLGGNRQRPLWASTGVKDPSYPDTRYVSDLVAADTVNTMPERTLLAFADHGACHGDQVSGNTADDQQVIDDLALVGISYDEVIDTLEREGVDKFIASWEELVTTVDNALHDAR